MSKPEKPEKIKIKRHLTTIRVYELACGLDDAISVLSSIKKECSEDGFSEMYLDWDDDQYLALYGSRLETDEEFDEEFNATPDRTSDQARSVEGMVDCIVELDTGLWLSFADGLPFVTEEKAKAYVFVTCCGGERALEQVRVFKPYPNARVINTRITTEEEQKKLKELKAAENAKKRKERQEKASLKKIEQEKKLLAELQKKYGKFDFLNSVLPSPKNEKNDKKKQI